MKMIEYKSEYEIDIRTILQYNLPEENIQKEFLINFLKEIPIEKLKQLLNFKIEIHHETKIKYKANILI